MTRRVENPGSIEDEGLSWSNTRVEYEARELKKVTFKILSYCSRHIETVFRIARDIVPSLNVNFLIDKVQPTN